MLKHPKVIETKFNMLIEKIEFLQEKTQIT